MVAEGNRPRRRPIRPGELERQSRKGKAAAFQGEVEGMGLYPLDAPGIPLPGPDFMENARRLGDKSEILEESVKGDDGKKRKVKTLTSGEALEGLYRRALREPGFEMSVQIKAGIRKPVPFVPGHIWGQYAKEYADDIYAPVDGPRPADVMVIGKMPGRLEVEDGRNFVGESGRILVELLRELKIKGTPSWYVTSVLKFRPPDGTATIKAGWLRDCMPLLHQELRIVRPKYILCLGADASKALLGTKHSVSYMEGRVLEYDFPINTEGEEVLHTSLVMTVNSPAQISRAPEMRRVLWRGLARFSQLQEGKRWDLEEEGVNHQEIRTLEQLKAVIWEAENDPEKKDKVVGVDAEWHGEHPVNKGSYVRTVQFAWRPKNGCSVVLRGPGGKISFVDKDGEDAIERGIALLNEYFKDKRITGHFFVADLEWLVDIGLDLRRQFRTPLYDLKLERFPNRLQCQYRRLGYKKKSDIVPAWVRSKYEGGADTGLMAHAIEESAMLGLESLALRYTGVPRYDVPLHDWRVAYCKENGLKSKDLEGYGECPDEILVPYGIYDADATLRLYYALEKLLDYDYEGNCCREPFWESMIACPGILEMHQTGIPVDKERIDMLTAAFMEARTKQEEILRGWANWPTFNIRSVQQVREFLFGEELNGKITSDGSVVQVRPPDGKTLRVEPLMDTSKPPKPWWEVKEKELERENNPSTNKMVLAILAQENLDVADQVNWVRDYRFLDQVLKSLLRPPVMDDDGNWLYEDDGAVDNMGGLIFDAGLAHVVCSDGRVRTHLYPTTDTGRWRSARPNLQNISKQRDPDYARMLGATKDDRGRWVGGKYTNKLRSVLKAPPGHVLIEADYIGAELFGMAIMSGDSLMIEHCQRNQLDEYHEDFYDIHSNVAVFAFQMTCAPTKTGLKGVGKEHLRIVAKSVIFGIAYGRGAKAIALAAKEQKVNVSVEDAQCVIDAIFELYPGLVPFFEECRRRVSDEGWLCHCFGRFRRFAQTDDRKLTADFERTAMNFPIQGMVASAMDRAVAYTHDYRRRKKMPDMYKMVLQIHDAILLLVPYKYVEQVVDVVLPFCMVRSVPIYPTELDGSPTGDGPYRLGIDIEVMTHWGEKLTKKQAKEWGIPEVTKGGVKIAA